MQIGSISARKGEKAFGFFNAALTHGQFDAQIPLHIVNGASDGPTLLIQAGVSGVEIEPAMILPKIIDELDPASIAGTLLLVPLLNISGFEFEQQNAIWDNKDLATLGRGREDGSISEQVIFRYYQDVVSPSDAVVDIRTGALWGYFRYVGVYETGKVEQARDLALALGRPQVLIGQPSDRLMVFEAAQDGKIVASAWIGGGPGLRDYRNEDLNRIRQTVLNAMRHLGMLAEDIVIEEPGVSLLKAHSVINKTGKRGMVFMAKDKRGKSVVAGEQIGVVRHPFRGDVIATITAPRDGVMLHAGAVWPMPPEDALLAILGDPVT